MAVLYFVLLVLVFFAVGFGAIRLLLRGGPFEEYTFEGAVLAGPLLTVLVFSWGGYHRPLALTAWQAWCFVLAAAVLSVAVAIRDRHSLLVLLRDNGRRLLVILAAAAWSAAVLMIYFPGSEWAQFYHLSNHEYLNYVQLAGRLTGHFNPDPELWHPFLYDVHPTIRYGQDLITGTVALVSGQHPINVVLPLSVFFRLQYTVVLGVLLYRLAGPRSWLVPLLLFVHGFLLVETFSFSSSFMSSNCTLPVFVAYLALLHAERPGWRGVVLLIAANVYFLITYPEFLTVVKVFEVLLLAVWLLRRDPRGKGVLLANLLVCLLHPLLVRDKVRIAFQMLSWESGFNAFGDPRADPWMYLANLFSLRYSYSDVNPWASCPWLAGTVVVLVAAATVAGLCLLAFRYRLAVPVVVWAILLLALHLKPLLRNEAHFYSALKFATQTSYLPLLALLACCLARARVLRWGAWAVVFLWGCTAGFATLTVYPKLPKYTFIRYNDIRDALAAHHRAGEAVTALTDPAALMVSYLAANECRLPFVTLSRQQQARMFWLSPGDAKEHACDSRRRGVFEGLIVVDAFAHCSRRFEGFEFSLGEPLAVTGCYGVFRGRIRHASGVDCGGGEWITSRGDWQPTLFATGSRLTLSGVLPPEAPFTMPYRFRVRVPNSTWSQEVVLDSPGPFRTTVTLPADLTGRLISLAIDLEQTCRTQDINPHWCDPHARVGFLMHSIAVEEAPDGP